MMGGDIFANTAGYGGGVFVSDTGTFNFSGGTISSNISTTDMGAGIYSYGTVKMTDGVIANNSVYISRGTFEMTGGSFANSPLTISNSVTSLTLSGSFVNSPIEIYGEGNIVRGITASSTGTALSFFNGQSFIESGKIAGNISVATGATLYLNDNVEMVGTYILPGTAKMIVYGVNGEFPVMNIDATGHDSSVLAIYEGTNKPDISRINVTGFDAGQYEVVVEKSVTGVWEILLVDVSPKTFDTNWKTQLSSTLNTYSINGTISFEKVAPTNYSFVKDLSSGIKVYKKVESSKTSVAFVAGKIFAPSDCSTLFAQLNAQSILFNHFDTSNVTNMSGMFQYCSSIKNFDVSNFNTSNVTNMENLFYYFGSSSLHVDLSSWDFSNITNGTSMFYGFRATNLIFSNTLKSAYSNMFRCAEISEMQLPSSVTKIESGAFVLASISQLVLSEGLLSIANRSFQNFGTSSKLIFPASLTTFETTDGTTDPNDTADTFIESNIFAVEFATGSKLKFLPRGVFYGCSSLQTVVLAEGLLEIGNSTFMVCTKLKDIYIPKSLTKIGVTAFDGDSGINVHVSDMASYLSITFAGNTSMPTVNGGNLFEGETIVTNLTVPGTVTTLKAYQLRDCASIISVTFASGVKSVSSYAFQNCSNLESVTVSSTLTTVESDAFFGCSAISKVCAESIESWCNIRFVDYNSNPLYNGADFYIGTTLQNDLVIPDSVSSINTYSFYGSGLKRITFENSSSLKVGNYAFANIKGLTEVSVVGSGKFTFAYYTFSSSEIEKVDISDLKAWCASTFSSSTSTPFCGGAELYVSGIKVSTLTIPEDVTAINTYAFYGCKSYSELVMRNVTSVENAFGKSKITTLTSQQDVAPGLRSSGAMNNVETWNLICGSNSTVKCFSGIPVKYLNIGEGFTSCSSYAFKDYTSLIKVVFPSTFNTFEKNFEGKSDAFAQNYTIQEVDMSACSNLGEISAGAFYECKQLVSVLFSTTDVRTIGSDAFSGCTSLANIDLSGIMYFYSNAFYNCINMVPSFPSYFYDVGNNVFKNCRSITGELNVRFVSGCGDYVFQGCTGITKVTVGIDASYDPNLVIGAGMFAGCTGLQSATVNGGVGEKSIDMFHSCTSLSSVTFGSGVTWLPQSMFYGCTSLKYFEMPKYITDVGIKVFRKCSNLIEVTWSSSCSLKKISDQMFSECASLETFNWSSKITEIGEKAFEKCTSLRSGNTYSALTKIGANAFSGCTALSAVSYETPLWNATSSDGTTSASVTITTASDFATKLRVIYVEYFWTARTSNTFTLTLSSIVPSTMTIAVGSSFGTPTVSPSSYDPYKDKMEINRGFTEYSDRAQTAILPNDKKGLKVSIEKVEKD